MSLKKITGNETPRPLRGKTNKFNRLVRFVDLNESLKEIEENFIQLPANPSNGDALVFNGTEWVPGSVGGDSSMAIKTRKVIVTNEMLQGVSSENPSINLIPAESNKLFLPITVILNKTGASTEENVANTICEAIAVNDLGADFIPNNIGTDTPDFIVNLVKTTLSSAGLFDSINLDFIGFYESIEEFPAGTLIFEFDIEYIEYSIS